MTPAPIKRQQPKFATIPDDPRRSHGHERQRRLVEVVRAWLLEDPAPGKQLARFFMYYDGRADSPLPVVAKEWDSEEARAVSAVVPM